MRHPLATSAQLAATLAAAGVAVAACGGGATTSATSAPAAQTAGEQPATTASSEPVRVQLNEFTIQLPQQSLRPGTYTFVASNDGQLPHALEIEGPGGLEQATETLSAGQSADLTVTLQPGSYKLYCPVGNHDEQGMNTTINVTG